MNHSANETYSEGKLFLNTIIELLFFYFRAITKSIYFAKVLEQASKLDALQNGFINFKKMSN